MKTTSFQTYYWTWLALLALLALTFASAYVHLGSYNLLLNLGIAVMKTLLVAIVFMQLRQSSAIVRIVAVAGLFWVSLLVALSVADMLTRP